jgi:NAD(P)-dependent dehydrogenase (short-subunit alcohol dehydrogenase family)
LESKNTLEQEFQNSHGIFCDFSDSGSISKLINSIDDLQLDALVNNAITGIETNHFHKLTKDFFLESFRKNILPVISITQAAILHFRKKKSGKIVTVLTQYLEGKPPIGMSEYIAEKNYLLALSKSWATENEKFGISANCISPSFMYTGLTANTDERVLEEIANQRHDKKLLTTEDAAEGIVYFLQSPASVTGQNLFIHSIADIPHSIQP